MADQTPPQKKDKKTGYIIIIAILILLSGALGVFVNEKDTEVENLEETKAELLLDIENLNSNLESMKSDNDSMNVVLESERTRLNSMIDSVENLRQGDLKKIKEYKRKVYSYKLNNKKLAAQVDSLQEANRILAEQKAAVEMDLMEEQERSSNLEGQNRTLQKEVAIGAVLQLTKMEAAAYRVKSSGSEKETTSARRTNRVKGCFTIAKNLIAEKGEKVVYMRISTPSNTVLAGNKDANGNNTFSFNGQDLIFSNSLAIYYEGEPLESCISFDKEGEFEKGEYLVELFTEGYKIGESKVVLD
ncbi:MAG: hypothetical protein SchgKO_00630 [Schleiferiaceae bacterium]